MRGHNPYATCATRKCDDCHDAGFSLRPGRLGLPLMHPFALPVSARVEVRDRHKPFSNIADARATAMHCGFGHITIPLVQPPKWHGGQPSFHIVPYRLVASLSSCQTFPTLLLPLLPQSILILCKDWSQPNQPLHLSFGSIYRTKSPPPYLGGRGGVGGGGWGGVGGG